MSYRLITMWDNVSSQEIDHTKCQVYLVNILENYMKLEENLKTNGDLWREHASSLADNEQRTID